ncbi:hypothetical protein AB0C84_40450 [Actinomadura sp. NPDC048955]|uniref:hypothetical protein n=1 Tax=Actinomadura sp. NPDC048955 TaxID=3158228 RepID=UPI0033D12F6D
MTSDVSSGTAVRRVLDAYQARPHGFKHFEAELDAADVSDADLWRYIGELALANPPDIDRAALLLAEAVQDNMTSYTAFRTDRLLERTDLAALGQVIHAVMQANQYPGPDPDYRDGWSSAVTDLVPYGLPPEVSQYTPGHIPSPSARPTTAGSDPSIARRAGQGRRLERRRGRSTPSEARRRGFLDKMLYTAEVLATEHETDPHHMQLGRPALAVLSSHLSLGHRGTGTGDLDLWGIQARSATVLGRYGRLDIGVLGQSAPSGQAAVGAAVHLGNRAGDGEVGTVIASLRPDSSIYWVKVPGWPPTLGSVHTAMAFPRLELGSGGVSCALEAERRLVETAALAQMQRTVHGAVRPETQEELHDLTLHLAHWCGRDPAELYHSLAVKIEHRCDRLLRLIEAEPRLAQPGGLRPARSAPPMHRPASAVDVDDRFKVDQRHSAAARDSLEPIAGDFPDTFLPCLSTGSLSCRPVPPPNQVGQRRSQNL